MKTTTINYQNPSSEESKCCQSVEKIFLFLNQGSLNDIYKMLEELRSKDQIKMVSDAFAKKYDFNFLNYI